MSDLLVVGGGPVGLAAALYAERAGLTVTVWERRAGVLDKACGEGLMPSAVAALEGLGVAPDGCPLDGVDYLDDSRRRPASARARFHGGRGRGVRRTVLHQALRSAVADAGVTVTTRALTHLEHQPGAVLADGHRFGHVLAADGLHSGVRQQLGLQGRPARWRRYGLRAHVRTAPWTSYVEVHWAPGAEAYVTPVADDLVGVALLTQRRAPFEVQLADFPRLAARLGDRWEPVRGAGPLHQRARRRVHGRVLLVGDAAGYVDALTGEGIALGLAQARAAVSAVTDGQAQRYEREWRRLTAPHRWLTGGLLAATQVPTLRRALVPAASRVPGVFDAAVATLAGATEVTGKDTAEVTSAAPPEKVS